MIKPETPAIRQVVLLTPSKPKTILTAFPTLHWWHICIVSPSYIIERILFPVSMGGWSGSMEKSSNKRWTNVSLTVTRSRYSSPPGPFIRGRGRIYPSSTSGDADVTSYKDNSHHCVSSLLWFLRARTERTLKGKNILWSVINPKRKCKGWFVWEG